MESYDKDNVSEETKTKILKYVKDHPGCIDPTEIGLVLKDTVALGKWVKYITDYIKDTDSNK